MNPGPPDQSLTLDILLRNIEMFYQIFFAKEIERHLKKIRRFFNPKGNTRVSPLVKIRDKKTVDNQRHVKFSVIPLGLEPRTPTLKV